MNVIDLILFFRDKEEHYPISDEFIENYQQLYRKNDHFSYLVVAEQTNHPICPQQHEPNQKWHLYESYFPLQLFNEGGNPDFKTNGFRCPELLLWMAEAAGIEDGIVREASDYAKEKIDEIRKASPSKPYSSASALFINKKIKEKYGLSLWEMIAKRIAEEK